MAQNHTGPNGRAFNDQTIEGIIQAIRREAANNAQRGNVNGRVENVAQAVNVNGRVENTVVQLRNTKGKDILIKRLQRELKEVLENPPPLCSAGMGDDLFHWTATIAGPKDSVYEGGVFNLSLSFSKEYPFRPPKVSYIYLFNFLCRYIITGSVDG